MEKNKKTIYFNMENQDIYEVVMSKGRNASKYICDLIRADLYGANADELIDHNVIKMLMSEVELLKHQINSPIPAITNKTITPVEEEISPLSFNLNGEDDWD